MDEPMDEFVDRLKHFVNLGKSDKIGVIEHSFLWKFLRLLNLVSETKYLPMNDEFIKELTKVMIKLQYYPNCSLIYGNDFHHLYIILQGIVVKKEKTQNQKGPRKSILNTIVAQKGFYPLIETIHTVHLKATGSLSYLRLPGKVYKQFLQFLRKYQSSQLAKFIQKWMHISYFEVIFNKLEQKVTIKNWKKASNVELGSQSFYVLLKGEVQMRFSPSLIKRSNQKTKRPLGVILTEGALFYHILQDQNRRDSTFKAIEDCTFLQFDSQLLSIIFQSVHGSKQQLAWVYGQLKMRRNQYINGFEEYSQQNQKKTLEIKLGGIRIETAKRPKKKSLEIRKSLKYKNNQNNWENWKFISNLPYEKIIEGKQIVMNRKNKVYAKKQQTIKPLNSLQKKQLRKKLYQERMLALKVKTIAQKQVVNTANLPASRIKNPLFDDSFSHESDEPCKSGKETKPFTNFSKTQRNFLKSNDSQKQLRQRPSTPLPYSGIFKQLNRKASKKWMGIKDQRPSTRMGYENQNDYFGNMTSSDQAVYPKNIARPHSQKTKLRMLQSGMVVRLRV